jgi:hypothetical protein
MLSAHWEKFVWGFIGAIAPKVLSFFYLAQQDKDILPAYPIQFFIALIFYAIIGGLVSVAWADDHPFKCFMVGAATPRIIASLPGITP